MSLIRAPLSCPLAEERRGAVAVLGNLDGVHKGHQALLAEAASLARSLAAPLGAVTFDPHPRRVFDPDAPPFLLTTLTQKAAILTTLGCEQVMALPFGEALASRSPEAFVEEVLARVLGLRGVVVGDDFRFGAKRAGDAEALARLGEARGLTVRALGVTGGAGEEATKWSSTTARQALRDGRPEEAAEVMGRPFAVTGEVLEGRRLARTMDFPTANMTLGELVRPRYGVYAVRAVTPEGERHGGVANIGVRPTVDGKVERLEAHLFGYEGDLYGRPLTVELIGFVRDEKPFEGIDQLKSQIARDAEAARGLLASG